MRLPSTIPAGQRCSQLTESIDICPTICELLGQSISPTVQGKSLLPIIKDPSITHKDAVYSQGGVERHAIKNPGLNYEEQLQKCYYNKQRALIQNPEAILRAHMLRTDTHKLIYRLSGSHELYDLVSDPDELHNRWGDSALAHVQTELQTKLLNFFVEYQNDTPIITELWA